MSIAAIAVQGAVLQIGNGSSPETFTSIANITKLTYPLKAKTVDVTNISNTWQQLLPTLLMQGDLTLDIEYVMEEVTHRNSGIGLMNAFTQKTLRDFQIIYNDGNSSTDAFSAYVTGFQKTGQVAGVWTATVTLSATGTPSLV